MWLRHGKPKECSHFLRLANKKEKNVNEGTKISKVSFFLTAAVLKCSTSNPFPYNQNIASLLQLHIPTKGNIERRKKMLSGLFKVLQKSLIREVPVLVSVPVKLTDTSQQAPLQGTVVENKPAAACAVAVPQLCLCMAGLSLQDLTAHLDPFFFPRQYKQV